jgi:hypothetical protein
VLKGKGIKTRFLVGCDLFKEWIKDVKQEALYDDCVICDVRYLPFKKASFDTVLCLNVIEHLTKKDGLVLLKQIDYVASKGIVLSTPVNFRKQFKEFISKNPFQEHKSGWTVHELKELGFSGFRGQGFFMYDRLRGDVGSELLLVRKILATVVSYLVSPLSYYHLDVAYSMICFRNKVRDEH